MPKRIVDGEAIWTSRKLNAVEPPELRAEFANILPLALANGVFEADARLVWSRVYSFNRPDCSIEFVEDLLKEFERVGLLRRWTDAGKTWGFFIGIDKPGRLPPASRIERRHDVCGPEPPGKAKEEPAVNGRVASGQPVVSQPEANGYVGSGSGSCLCSGNYLEGFDRFWAAYPRKVGKAAAERVFKRLRPDKDLLKTMLIALEQQKASRQWQKEDGQFIPHPATWLNQARWEDEPTRIPSGQIPDHRVPDVDLPF
jgi:hypothetical protein